MTREGRGCTAGHYESVRIKSEKHGSPCSENRKGYSRGECLDPSSRMCGKAQKNPGRRELSTGREKTRRTQLERKGGRRASL